MQISHWLAGKQPKATFQVQGLQSLSIRFYRLLSKISLAPTSSLDAVLQIMSIMRAAVKLKPSVLYDEEEERFRLSLAYAVTVAAVTIHAGWHEPVKVEESEKWRALREGALHLVVRTVYSGRRTARERRYSRIKLQIREAHNSILHGRPSTL